MLMDIEKEELITIKKEITELVHMEEVADIAFVVDKNYAPHMGVLMTSIIMNTKYRPIRFHIINDGIEDSDRKLLDKFSVLYSTDIRYYEISTNIFDNVEKKFHFSNAIWYKMFVPIIVGPEVKRILFLDADMICLKDLSPLWDTDLDSIPLASAHVNTVEMERANSVGITSGTWVGAAFVLFNTEEWRKRKLTEQIINYAIKNQGKFYFTEEDALSVVLEGCVARFVDEESYLGTIDLVTGTEMSISEDTAIVHFSGSLKPWHSWCHNKRKQIYWDYARNSLWKNLNPTEPSNLKHLLGAAQVAKQEGNHQGAIRYMEMAINHLLKK